MKYHDLAKLLRQAGFVSRPGKGDHEVWRGPYGVQTVLVRDRECSPKVTNDALEAIKVAAQKAIEAEQQEE